MSALEVLGTVFLSVVSSVGLVWLVREWISTRLKESITHEYDRKRIQFEADLKREADSRLERLRSDLSIEAARRTAELTRVHERRMEVLSKLCGILHRLRTVVSAYTSPMEFPGMQPKADRRKAVAAVLAELDDFYAPNRCFIPVATCKRIEAFRGSLRDLTIEFMDSVESAEAGQAGREERTQAMAAWDRARTVVMDETPRLLDEIHVDCQRLLGIDESSPRS